MAIRLDGSITEGTKRNLIDGVRSSAMPSEAVDAVFDQVSRFADGLVDTYSSQIAAGEVGQYGSAQASEDEPIGDQAPRALLYGRIQSGKTVSMILTSALCMDNGFRVVVVLTTDNVALVKQTADRFKDLAGPRVFAGVKDGQSYEWQGQEEELRASVSQDGIILVCAKNAFNLPEVIRFLVQIDASTYPVLVLDDEADAATPDTTLAARSAARPNAPSVPSRMHRLVFANDAPGEVGLSLGEVLPHSLYVQVTATPYVLFLQREAAATRPTDTFLLEAGGGYCGGEAFFGDFDPNATPSDQAKTVVLVAANEGTLMKRAAPPGLAKSINLFVLSASALSLHDGKWPRRGFKHLSHTSHKTEDHELVAGYINAHLNKVRNVLRGATDSRTEFFTEAYAELNRSVIDCPPLDDIISVAKTAIGNAEVYRINSKVDAPEYGPRLNFLVGGNILGRGLTIDDLLVTYYVREAKTSQMDTVWQHARMYGYRRRYLSYVRVYLPPQLAIRFQQIHEAEEALRGTLAADGDATAVLIRVPTSSRPTRPNALETGAIRTVKAGRDQVFPYFLKNAPASAGTVLAVLTENAVPVGGVTPRQDRPTRVPLEKTIDLINCVEIADDDPGLWDPATIVALLNSFADKLNGEVVVYAREVEGAPPAAGWWRGRLSGPEITLLRNASPEAPSLALLYSGNPDAPQGWYPTLVMPSGSPTFVFSGD